MRTCPNRILSFPTNIRNRSEIEGKKSENSDIGDEGALDSASVLFFGLCFGSNKRSEKFMGQVGRSVVKFVSCFVSDLRVLIRDKNHIFTIKSFGLMKTYFILFLAIAFETAATSFLKQSEQFTKLIPSVLTVLGYAAAFYCLSLVLKSIPVGIAYAIWSGVGIIFISLIGLFIFKQHLDFPAVLGLVLIIAGVVVINVFSDSVSH